jgi:hypothetical protein
MTHVDFYNKWIENPRIDKRIDLITSILDKPLYPVKIVIEPRKTGSQWFDSQLSDYVKIATDAKSLEEELDKIITTDIMASKISYIIQLNELPIS